MTIDLDTLRLAVNRILDELQADNVTSVEITDDYYGDIARAELYDPLHDPKTFTIGQLTDDWDRLQEIASGETEPIAYGLAWAAPLLRRIGETVVS